MELVSHCILCTSPELKTHCPDNLFSQCRHCGHFFDNPRPTEKEISDFYSKETQYDEWLDELSARDRLWKRRLNLVLKYKQGGKLLDVGAGIGQFLSFAKSHFDVYGSEISDTAVALAKSRYNLTLKQGLLSDIQWPHRFDILTMFHVLEHFQFPGEALKNCASLLEEDGFLVIAVPNDVESILTRRNRWMRSLGFKKYQELGTLGLPKLRLDFSELHLSHFTETTLIHAVQDSGFSVVDCTVDPFFAVSGLSRSFRRHARYWFYKSVARVFGKNLYETIWIVAQKKRSN
jgi:ubiquinone/menaquinone biosynthesis C-methylase UbiE